jgi:thiopeptide-type bacteriocin biosynthesis protein
MKSSVRGHNHTLLRLPLGSVNQTLALFAASKQGKTSHWLREFYEMPMHQQALYLASPMLWSEVDRWLQSPNTVLLPELELSIARYAIRSASRSTPFGLFAGLSIASVGTHTDFVFAVNRFRPFTRLDSSALVQLYEQILAVPQWRHQLRFTVTNSAYPNKGQYRYSEFVESERGRLVVMSSLDADIYLDALISFATGYRTFDELSRFMAQQAQVEISEAGEYIDVLIDSKFLLSELEPTVTGLPYIQRLKNWLSAVDSPSELLIWVLNQPTVIKQLTEVPILRTTDTWLKNHDIVSSNHQSFWQTNLWYAAKEAVIARSVVDQIGTQISEVFPALEQPRPNWIGEFTSRFKSRYQDRSVPLLEVLDNESGLGLRLANQYLSAPAPRAEQLLSQFTAPPATTRPLSLIDALRRRLIQEARRSGGFEVELLARDLPTGSSAPTGCWSVLGSLLSSHPVAGDGSEFNFMTRYVNANPTALAGRFSRDSDELTDLIQTIHEEENRQWPDCVLAEVVHLAGARSGNVNVRPTLRPYEIPYLTPESVGDEYVINLSDLLVSVSDGGEIRLFSTQLGKRVMPRLTTAHNVVHGDEVYQFLCGISHQQGASAQWSWNEYATEPFLPRVRYKKLILARAQWHISTESLKQFDNAENCWRWFRENYPVNQHVTIQAGDNELVVDIDSPLGNRFVLSELAKRKKITMAEWLTGPDQCWVKDSDEQPYSHEALLFFESPMDSRVGKNTTLANHSRPESPASKRKFPPGSQWLYLKLYCGPQTANQLLTGPIWETLTQLSEQGQVQQWFFVRYLDPEFHLRLRVRCDDPAQRSGLLVQMLALSEQWLEEGFIDLVQTDTYDRELERYGPQTIELCEDYFGVDSRMVIDFLSQHPYADEETLIHFAVASALALVTDFGFTDAECLTFFRSRQQAYHREFFVSKAVKDTLNQQYRGYREKIKNWQDKPNTTSGSAEGSPVCSLLRKRSVETQHIINNLTQKWSDTSTDTVFSLVGSLLHMSMNRLLTSQLRLYELIIYHLSCRYYESTVARSKA